MSKSIQICSTNKKMKNCRKNGLILSPSGIINHYQQKLNKLLSMEILKSVTTIDTIEANLSPHGHLQNPLLLIPQTTAKLKITRRLNIFIKTLHFKWYSQYQIKSALRTPSSLLNVKCWFLVVSLRACRGRFICSSEKNCSLCLALKTTTACKINHDFQFHKWVGSRRVDDREKVQ